MSSTAPVPRAGGLRHRIKAAQNDRERKDALQGIARMFDHDIRRRKALARIEEIGARRAKEIEVMAALVEDGLVPVSLGDLRGPEGNVFPVINACREGIKYAEKHGIPVTAGAVDVVNNFMNRTYGETLMLIQMYYLDINNSVAELRAWDLATSRNPDIADPPPNTVSFRDRKGD